MPWVSCSQNTGIGVAVPIGELSRPGSGGHSRALICAAPVGPVKGKYGRREARCEGVACENGSSVLPCKPLNAREWT